MKQKLLNILMLLAIPGWMSAATFYISPTGNDANDGQTQKTAFATLKAAQELVEAGDTVLIMAGTYQVTEAEIMNEENVGTTGQYKIVFDMAKSGEDEHPICYIGMADKDGNRPVFDLSQVKPTDWRVTGFRVSGQYLIFKNFEVVGIQINRTDHTQAENFRITNGCYNTFENIACHDGMGIGFYLNKRSAYNLFINCDGYNNYDPISDIDEKTGLGSGGNNDAFGCHVLADCPNNIFIGCRAWNNADDGYDLISCASPTTFCYSIAYKNGYDGEGTSRGDGNGFKAGGYGMSTEKPVSDVTMDNVPMHEVYHCIAASNKANGIYSNHHLGGVYFHDNTAYRNSRYNYNLVNRKGVAVSEAVDVNGYKHKLERNLSIVESSKDNHITYLRGDEGDNSLKDNNFYWDNYGNGGWAYTVYGNSIFESTTLSNLLIARDADGMLSEQTLSVMKQKAYIGNGASFESYRQAIEEMRKISGAEIDKGTTAIQSISQVGTGKGDNAIYDLQGRRVNTPKKGIYIQNGQKILIR